MLRLLMVVLVLSAVGLSGCKIKVISGPGGTVKTVSGNYTCTPGPGCVVDAGSVDFQEEFFAEPDEGFVFVGWKLRARGLCGGKRGSCNLFYPEFLLDRLLPIINNPDQEFYLEAQFSPVLEGDGPIDEVNATACYNQELLQPGTRFEAIYESVVDGFADQTAHDQFVDGAAMFNGQDVIQTTTTFESLSRDESSTAKSYYTVDAAQKRITNVGAESTDSFGGSGVQIFDPGQLFRYDLKPGQSFNQVVTVESIQEFEGQEFSSVSELEQTVTYVGVQEITVPAGTYRACRFEITGISRFEGQEFESSLTIWNAEGSGVLLRDADASGDFSTSLVEGTLNGTAL